MLALCAALIRGMYIIGRRRAQWLARACAGVGPRRAPVLALSAQLVTTNTVTIHSSFPPGALEVQLAPLVRYPHAQKEGVGGGTWFPIRKIEFDPVKANHATF